MMSSSAPPSEDQGAAAALEKALAMFPRFDPSAPKVKHFPVLHTTWDPAIIGLSRVESHAPELIKFVTDEKRDVDQIKAFLVDLEAQNGIIDRIQLEAEHNGTFCKEKLLDTAAARAIIAAAREARQQGTEGVNESWKGPYVQQLTEAFRVGVELDATSDSTFAGVSYATKWHEKRRDDIMKQYPDVAAFVRNAGGFPLSVAIGLLAATINVYMVFSHVPRVFFRCMLETSSYKNGFVQSFTPSAVFGEYLGGIISGVESFLSILSPFSLFAAWIENNVADTYKVIAFAMFLIYVVLLAAVWGWWANHAAFVMTCELAAETVGGWLAVDTKPSRSAVVQQVRYLVKHAIALAMNPVAMSGVPFEHALLGYRGHVEYLGSGELTQSHHRILNGIPTHLRRLDGGLSLPHHILLQQRRWKAILRDKFGVQIHAYPTNILRAARVRNYASVTDLLREEAKLLDPNGPGVGPGLSLLDASRMEDYLREDAEAHNNAVTRGLSLEVQYGAEKRAMTQVILFAKEFFTSLRGASPEDLRNLSSRLNFKSTDPRSLKCLTEIVHPGVNPSAFEPFSLDKSVDFDLLRKYPRINVFLRDSGFLAVCNLKSAIDSTMQLGFFSVILVFLKFFAVLQHVPGYRQTFGKLWELGGRQYQRDNYGMYVSVEGCHMLVRRLAGLIWQGVRSMLCASLWLYFVFFTTKSIVVAQTANSGKDDLLGWSSWTIAFIVLLSTGAYAILAEMFAQGFLWHPMWFIQSVGHMTLRNAIHVSGTSAMSATTDGDDEWTQPTASVYGSLWFWLTLGQTHHVEQHDFPRIPWIHRWTLRQRAPKFYDATAVHSYDGVLHAARTYLQYKGEGVYAGHNE